MIVRKFIRCRPSSSDFCRRNARDFARTGRFPNIIGAIDGSCVKIDKPGHSGWQYYCRKGYTAINVLAAVNASEKFTYINANFPGSVHDASMYAYSSLKDAFANGQVLPGYCFVGDSGFPNGNDIITPIRNPSRRQEVSYNKWHRKMHVVVECALGKWKRKFAILRDGIRVTPRKAAKIIIACAVLHNMMVDMGCLRLRELGQRVAVCPHLPRGCADIRSYLVGMM
ncbi:transposase, IS4 family [Oesophagostomum dentatum]|uniref:Transposase, IS4 family n=1 Tax=Oesophagostomum dentatum TaxID=61180 RepID=A0A0B1TQS3_OESDE|nr:transposase, IS4 family [Oesophagostomum dentatum]